MSYQLKDFAVQNFAFDSDEISFGERYSYWEDVVCNHLSPTHNTLLSPLHSFYAQLHSKSFGNISTCSLISSPISYNRTLEMIKKIPNDNVFISLIEKGAGYIEQYGSQSLCTAGDIVVYDSGVPFSWNLTEITQMKIAMLPRDYVSQLIPQMKRISSRPIKSSNIMHSLISSNINELIKLNIPTCFELKKLERTFSYYLSSSIELSFFQEGKSNHFSYILDSAKVYIKDNIEDPDVSVEKTSLFIGISKRTLARAFASEGTSFSKWLWNERLHHAYTLLSCCEVDNVSQAAMRSGFSDFSHFTRAFKSKFNHLPKILLK
ncbi:AraC family transcriptional regulator (plasmid) [Klebsiella michiganensis]|uniref:helix-turn-helix domain-containing protein n=1 Tax=Klebsiella michiganensis TaxID=1134687 RepID=UPI00265A313E|nr:AraC family transcriptional regulator [Klebsiella michiganensis]WKJ95813.1 AraC family transcriptional regulator [Klebsiella michiganensis]WKK01049.1 AraC family transcriptional regulator [Klebsiella michiganensis]WKK02841.1 AraC family transcriptional regulator [Klebsiella michiganensis]WKK07036.1 AraC family transcriptional regulator [Klebsiella michiganensis]